MNMFKRKSLYAALAGVGALGAVSGAADAVNVNANGIGQALIYPYYTVRADKVLNPYNSLLSIVNTSDSVIAVKVRFLEGKNSREVLDFNLFLSPYDVWTAGIVPTLAGGARMITNDLSCTIPPIPPGGVDFVNFGYSGSNSDKAGEGLDRTTEGYVEIISMSSYFSDTTTAALATHSGGVPDCGISDAQASADADFQPQQQGPLFGGISLVNVLSGTLFSEDAVALESFSYDSVYFPAGSIQPTLKDADPVSQVLLTQIHDDSSSTGGGDLCCNFTAVYTSIWTSGSPDTVSAVLMHDSIMNEFVLDKGTKSGTDWVATMPTKTFYVNVGTGNAPKLFQRNFNGTAGSCDDVGLNIVDREEFRAPTSFSPPPPSQTNALCWEANVVSFAGSNVLNSLNTTNIPTSFENGWLRINFPFSTTASVATPHKLINVTNTTVALLDTSTGVVTNFTGLTATYVGLPVVGFAVQNFNNGTLSSGGLPLQSNYGGNFVQKATTTIFN